MENTYHCYANRELSWLRFNERVLEEAEDSRLPLCERLSFLSIFQSNLDEFFMVRIGSLQDQMLLDKNARENKTNMTSGEQIDAALAFIHKLTARRDAAYNGLLEQLAEQGIRLLDFAHMEEESRAELEKLFRQDYLPLLSSFIISKKQAFPFLKNKGIYAVAVLSTKAEKKKIGIVPCGSEIFPRLVPVPGRTGCFILSEELILHFLPLLYKGYKVSSKTLARITRNADIDADLIYDEDLNYRDHMAEVVKKRKKLAPVRLELSREIDEEIIQSLCKNLKLDPKRVFEYDSPLDHSFLFQIEDQLHSHTDLFFAPRHPQPSPALDERKPIIPQIMQEDKLLHYPYESIRPFLQLLHEAACDPDVVCVGEMKSAEAFAAQEAARTGHAVITTTHANSCKATYYRMVTLCTQKYDMGDKTLYNLVTEAFPIVLFVKKLEDNSRRVMEITECEILEDGTRQLHTLYRYHVSETAVEDGKIKVRGEFQKVSTISASLQKRLLENGMPPRLLEQIAGGRMDINDGKEETA